MHLVNSSGLRLPSIGDTLNEELQKYIVVKPRSTREYFLGNFYRPWGPEYGTNRYTRRRKRTWDPDRTFRRGGKSRKLQRKQQKTRQQKQKKTTTKTKPKKYETKKTNILIN